MGRYGITVAVTALAVIAAGCSGGDTSAPRPTGAPPTTVTVAPTPAAASEPTAQSGTGQNGSGQGGGSQNGGGPTRPTTTTPTGVPYDPNVRCTDKVNYAGDPRSNAEINSIGERTGTCPAPQR